MNQPPSQNAPAQWRRPNGVAPGTWDYVNQRTIADHYDAFVADTPLCCLDMEILARVFPSLSSTGSEVIADLGCGSGRTAIDLANRGYNVLGVDLSQAMLEVLRNKVDSSDRPKDQTVRRWIQPIRANLVDLDGIASSSVNHAVCMFSTLGMIQGRANRRQALWHARRIVRPQGHLAVHVHHRWAAIGEPGGIRSLAKSWWRCRVDRNHEFGDSTYAYRGIERMFMHRFSMRELTKDLRSTGWRIAAPHCLSLDGSRVMKRPRLMRHRVGGFILIARK